ncbi:MAG: excisionase [Betaproteobacteria bacterium]|nr:excisionase [Betaproteobacteria bacterium]
MKGVDRPAQAPTLLPARFVTISLASIITGYTEKAIRRKIEDGVWVEGAEWKRAPDGHPLIDLQGYETWAGNNGKKRTRSRNSTRQHPAPLC